MEKRYRELQDKSWLETKYIDQKLEIPQISRMLGCSPPGVRFALKRYKIPIRNTKFKFHKLNDKGWLIKKYVDQKLGTLDIAKELGCTKHGVRVALKRHSILLRTSKDANDIRLDRRGYQSEFVQLNDKEWLTDKHVGGKLAPLQIARIVGAKQGATVVKALRHFNIPIRICRRPFTSINDNFKVNQSVIDGCLLGDGCILNKCITPIFRKKNKYHDHVMMVAESLCGNMAARRVKKQISKGPVGTASEGKLFECYLFTTLSHCELKPFCDRWYPIERRDYPVGFRKSIPQDIEINPTVLLHWFLDDGSTSYRVRDKKIKYDQIRLVFCTDSFTKEDQEMLAKKVNNKYDLDMKTTPFHNSSWRLRIPQSRVPKFFEIIGPPPVKSLTYKWKILATNSCI